MKKFFAVAPTNLMLSLPISIVDFSKKIKKIGKAGGVSEIKLPMFHHATNQPPEVQKGSCKKNQIQ